MKITTYLLLLFFLFSCNTSTDEVLQNEKKCYITKFNPVIIKVTGQELFTSEYIYDSNNNIIKKLDFSIVESGSSPGNPLPIPIYTTELKTTTTIIFNSNNLPFQIIQEPDLYNNQITENLSYINGRLNSKEIITKNLNYNLSSKMKYDYSYDSNNKITSVTGKHYDAFDTLDLTENQIIIYYLNGNLSSVTKSTINGNNYTTKTILEYSNYDTFKNPFKDIQVPFEDYIFIRFSKNNYTKYSKKYYVNDILQSQETKSFTYNYNENNYPIIAAFKCN